MSRTRPGDCRTSRRDESGSAGRGALADDPVRTLRVAVLAVQPGWSVDPGVESAARAAAPSLREASAERVRDELVALVNGPAAGRGLRLLDRLGVVEVDPARERRDARDASARAASLRRVGALAAGGGGDGRDRAPAWIALAPWGEALAGHLAEDLGDGLGRARRPEARRAAARRGQAGDARRGRRARALHRPRRASAPSARAGSPGASGCRAGPPACSSGWSRQHLRPMHLAQAGGSRAGRATASFATWATTRATSCSWRWPMPPGCDGRPPLEVWAGARGAVLRSLMEGAAEASAVAAAPPLLDGDDVMAAVGIGPGPDGRPAPRPACGRPRPSGSVEHARRGARAPCAVRPARAGPRDTPRDGVRLECGHCSAGSQFQGKRSRPDHSQGGSRWIAETAHCSRSRSRSWRRPRLRRPRRARSSSPRAWTRPRSTP